MMSSSVSSASLGLALTLSIVHASAFADDPKFVRGRLSEVDAAAKTVTVETADGAVRLNVPNDARLRIGDKAVSLGDLKVGRHVRIAYRDEDGSRRVVSLVPAVVTDKELKQRIAAAMEASKQYAHQRKDEYAAKLRGVVADLDDRIDYLQGEWNKASDEAKEKLSKRLAELKEKRQDLDGRLAKLRAAAADAWDDVKAGFSAAARDIENALSDD
jgi:gas vesicle protein